MPSLRIAGPAFLFALVGSLPPQVALEDVSGDVVGIAPIDIDGDGLAEVRSVRSLWRVGAEDAARVLVLVEPRIVGHGAGDVVHRPMRDRLERFAADLAREGFLAQVLAVEVHSGPPLQDGKTVLGMRRLFQAVAAAAKRAGSALAGAVLVGHFPDATLVRTCNWRRKGRVTLPDRDGKAKKLPSNARWLRRIPELVAHKFDLVLGDLDGDWEARYLGDPRPLERVEAWFVEADGLKSGGPCQALRIRTKSYRDVFHLADGVATADPEAFAVRIDDSVRDLECTPADRERVNGLAQPELAISRIDARGVAWSPRESFLGADGEPRTVEYPRDTKPPRWDRVWVPDPQLELRLLCDYFDRNHAYRTEGVREATHNPASIAWGLPSGMHILRRAEARWQTFGEAGYDVRKAVDLCAVAEWFRRPASLRTLRAHSNGQHAAFRKTDVPALERLIGGVPWSYSRRGQSLVPSLGSACGKGRADFFFYRTLWANRAVDPTPYVMVHTGCEAISPPNHQLRFDDPRYGARQHAESILFYTPCVALIGRAKVFYDEPRGFIEALRDGKTVGDGWRAYFATEAKAASWGKVGGDIGRKRSYFWSLLGDWTLRMPVVR